MYDMAMYLPLGVNEQISPTVIGRYGVRNWKLLEYALRETNLDKKIQKTRANLENWLEKLSSGDCNQSKTETIQLLARLSKKKARKWMAAQAEKASFFHSIRWNLFQLEVARFFDTEGSDNLYRVFALEWKISHLWHFSQAHGWVWKELETIRKSIQALANRVRLQQGVFETVASYGRVRERIQVFVLSSSKKLEILSCGRNEVYWNPLCRCVFKQSAARVDHEESLVESLSHFYGDVFPVSVKVMLSNQWKTRARPYFRLESLYNLKTRKIVHSAMKKLSAQGEMAAIFAAEMQFLDLSDANIHFAPCKNKDQLLMILLDSELSLAESNNILYIVDDHVGKSIFPFRSGLLGLPWAKEPLSEECLHWLYKLPAGEGVLWDWIRRKNGAFLSHFSSSIQSAILEKITHVLEQYSFSDYCARTGKYDFAKIRWCFVRDLAKMRGEEHKKFWIFVKEILPDLHEKVEVFHFQTLAYLAKEYAVSLSQLQKLNPEYSATEALPEGRRISIPMDLTSASFFAKQKRRRWAKQLFPRMTIRQQKALLERQKRRTSYLQLYRKLETSKILHPQDLLNFVRCPAIPLSTSVRQEWIRSLESLSPYDSKSLQAYKDSLIQLIKPSYYNLCLAMYPLLGDLIQVYQAAYPVGGINYIGSFDHPLEKTLALAKKLSDPQLLDLADQITEKTLGEKNRVYFAS